MAGSVNKVILIGNLGQDPEVRSMQSGDRVASFSVATSESWKDKTSGERKEKTEWHRIAVFNQGLVKICESYLRKGSKVYLEGQLETRKWQDKEGQDRYTTEVVLRNFGGQLTMLDTKGGGGASSFQDNAQGGYDSGPAPQKAAAAGGRGGAPIDEMEDEIPF